jgi:hypothetical protein
MLTPAFIISVTVRHLLLDGSKKARAVEAGQPLYTSEREGERRGGSLVATINPLERADLLNGSTVIQCPAHR